MRVDPRTARRWASLEGEYQEPIADIIAGFREQGATWRTTAGALGVGSLQTLIRWRRLLGMPVGGSWLFDSLSREERCG